VPQVVRLGGITPPRRVRNSCPSSWVPNSAMCSLRIATSSGGMGAGRPSSSAQCSRPRRPQMSSNDLIREEGLFHGLLADQLKSFSRMSTLDNEILVCP
jgi:hypothetical protein